MIELEVQFQLIISCIIFGMLFTNLYTFIDKMLGESKVLRFIIELCFFITFTIIFYGMLYIINKGIFNVYIPFSLLVGVYLHKRFYDKYFSCLYDYWFSKIHSIIRIKKDRCKKLWKGLLKKIIKKPKLTE